MVAGSLWECPRAQETWESRQFVATADSVTQGTWAHASQASGLMASSLLRVRVRETVWGLARAPAHLAVMSRCCGDRMCLMTGRHGCPAEPTAGTHFKATRWQRGIRVMGYSFVFVQTHPQPAKESVGAPLCSGKEAPTSSPHRHRPCSSGKLVCPGHPSSAADGPRGGRSSGA